MKSMRRAALQIGLVALTLSVVAVLSNSASGVSGNSEPAGPKFVVACTQIGQGGGIGPMSCVLTVSNLPAPLEDKVVVALSSTVTAEEGPTGIATSSGTNVSAAAPDTELGGPSLVSRDLAPALHPPPPVVPQVPTQPPRSL